MIVLFVCCHFQSWRILLFGALNLLCTGCLLMWCSSTNSMGEFTPPTHTHTVNQIDVHRLTETRTRSTSDVNRHRFPSTHSKHWLTVAHIYTAVCVCVWALCSGKQTEKESMEVCVLCRLTSGGLVWSYCFSVWEFSVFRDWGLTSVKMCCFKGHTEVSFTAAVFTLRCYHMESTSVLLTVTNKLPGPQPQQQNRAELS